MSIFNGPQKSNTHISRRPPMRSQAQGKSPSSGPDLFPIAVFIMGIVSCYTTAVGLFPMLGNWVLSYATAFALSVFMVAIALRIPKAFKEGGHGKLIAGYIFVAMFSVLLNFNAIYGVFSAEKLLYEELKTNKTELTAIKTRSIEALDAHFGAVETERKLQEAQALLEEETSNQVDPGYGQNARRLNQESVIPLRAELAAIRAKYNPVVAQIDSVVSEAQVMISTALEAKEISLYREAVDQSIDAYSQVGEMTQNLLGAAEFSYEPMVFKHRDVGNLNHSLWTLMNIPKLDAKQASSVIVSLLLSLLIDFIVLFVIVMINRPGKGDINGPDEDEEDSEESLAPVEMEQRQRNGSIYASRRNRSGNRGESHLNHHEIQRVGWQRPQPEPVLEKEEPEVAAIKPSIPADLSLPQDREPTQDDPETDRQAEETPDEKLILPTDEFQHSEELDRDEEEATEDDIPEIHRRYTPPQWHLPGEDAPTESHKVNGHGVTIPR